MVCYVITAYLTGVALMLWMWAVLGAPADAFKEDEDNVRSAYLSQALFWPVFVVVLTFLKITGALDEDE